MMKRYFHAFAMCQSMFCAIPFPGNLWDEEARDKMLLFLPVVGLELGALWVSVGWLCRWLGLPNLVSAFVLSVFPFISTGFLHLDGFMDVTDAVKSCRSLERRREILKDSHVGAFAVIGVALLLLAQFALFASVPGTADYRALLFVPALSRCCSALAVAGLKPMSTSQYAGLSKPVSHLVVPGLMALCFTAAGFLLFGIYGLVNVGCLAGYAWALHRGYRGLDGMNGDISGYSLTVAELGAVAVLALI